MSRPTTGQRLSSALAMKRAGCSAIEHENIEPRDVVGDDQHVAGQGGPPGAAWTRSSTFSMRSSRCDQRRISACSRGSDPWEHEHRRREALGDVQGQHADAREA